ncbi:DUF4153 domain-containing protein [Pseudohalocynthiibacter aestuariivivens]|uniref:DUF4153 domain-containing protein n=1 Tax=Pseudohalocynthiibacter aestuariivivens TaxID=1591409 RepID=A0ABV5JHD1_9RHOB|nr:DUF4153 domain-containing protein [Pseudohalocynthiibacter aestuariivivens]MBS9716980.1 DUF4153 domain-containing protein [Pseudohalocynthiibacter aestuariivivens]
MSTDTITNRNRLLLALIGGFAGYSFWFLFEVLEDFFSNSHVFLLIAAATFGFFGSLMALFGPLKLGRAALSAVVVAVPSALLLFWASFRFVEMEEFLETGLPLIAYSVLITIPLPFLITAQSAKEGWRYYPALFDHAWNIVVRYAAAWLFVGIFWAVVMLCNALFNIVGLTTIEDLLDIDWVPFALTGGILGLAIAVVNELSDYVSPFLILRLLRLLLPAFVVVVAVFVLALPLQGLSGLFAGLSAAATLLAIAVAAVTLVSTALEKEDADAVEGFVMLGSVRLLSLMTPIIVALAGYAVWLRVDQYGWTPDRLALATVVVLMQTYAVAYAVSVILRHNWMIHIRRANTYIALLLIALAALWLTPVLNPERISTNNQIARFEAGRTDVETLDVWAIGREWGHAGAAGLRRLEAMTDHPQSEQLQAKITRVTEASNRYELENTRTTTEINLSTRELLQILAVRPESAVLKEEMFARLPSNTLNAIMDGCGRTTPEGHSGCVALFVDLLPATTDPEVIVAYMTGSQSARLVAFVPTENGGYEFKQYLSDLSDSSSNYRGADTVDAILAGRFATGPAEIQVLRLLDSSIFIQP